MITIKESRETKTIWRGETAWDLDRKYEKSIYFLGIRIHRKAEEYHCVPSEVSKNVGFSK